MCKVVDLEEYYETGATGGEEEEDLSWDVDEEEVEEDVAPSAIEEAAELTEALPSTTRSIEDPEVASTDGKNLSML